MCGGLESLLLLTCACRLKELGGHMRQTTWQRVTRKTQLDLETLLPQLTAGSTPLKAARMPVLPLHDLCCNLRSLGSRQPLYVGRDPGSCLIPCSCSRSTSATLCAAAAAQHTTLAGIPHTRTAKIRARYVHLPRVHTHLVGSATEAALGAAPAGRCSQAVLADAL